MFCGDPTGSGQKGLYKAFIYNICAKNLTVCGIKQVLTPQVLWVYFTIFQNKDVFFPNKVWTCQLLKKPLYFRRGPLKYKEGLFHFHGFQTCWLLQWNNVGGWNWSYRCEDRGCYPSLPSAIDSLVVPRDGKEFLWKEVSEYVQWIKFWSLEVLRMAEITVGIFCIWALPWTHQS